ncbi:unnamed protein product [Blepharisma stoltei]|uniref:Uncharacterized protein n=1 Tax=Blepharisma stoltei TaxID=1481888 RepID=A0AAU9K1Q9_9CILI|nr:unnamed protein product [Blepharisma stoltei]
MSSMRTVHIKSFTFDGLDELRAKNVSPLRKNFSKKSLNVPQTIKSYKHFNENFQKKQLIYCSSEFMLNLLQKRPSIPTSERISSLNYKYINPHGIIPKSFPNLKPLKTDCLPKTPRNSKEDFISYIKDRPNTSRPKTDAIQAPQRPKTARILSKPYTNPFSITKEKSENIEDTDIKERKSDPRPIKRNNHEKLRIEIKIPMFTNTSSDDEITPYSS